MADETRFVGLLPDAENLFACTAAATLEAAFDAGVLPTTAPKEADSALQLGTVGIWLTRSLPRSSVRKRLRGWRTRTRGMKKVLSILNRARRRATDSMPFGPRTDREWAHLGKLVRELIIVVEQHFPLGSSAAESESTASASAPLASPPDVRVGPNDPLARWFHAIVERAVQQADEAMEGPPDVAAPRAATAFALLPFSFGRIVTPRLSPPGGAAPSDVGRDGCDSAKVEALDDTDVDSAEDDVDLDDFDVDDEISFDAEAYERYRPPFRRLAQSLAANPETSFEDGHKFGGRLTRPYRAPIDGRCFRHRTVQESSEAAVALLIDHSYSMCYTLGRFLPVVAALAEALQSLPQVDVGLWRFGSAVEHLPSAEELKFGKLMGSTATQDALGEALQWLGKKKSVERRIVVLFTDGEPDDVEQAGERARELRRMGVKLLVGSIANGLSRSVETLPGAIVFDVGDSDAASSLQVALKRIQT